MKHEAKREFVKFKFSHSTNTRYPFCWCVGSEWHVTVHIFVQKILEWTRSTRITGLSLTFIFRLAQRACPRCDAGQHSRRSLWKLCHLSQARPLEFETTCRASTSRRLPRGPGVRPDRRQRREAWQQHFCGR